jgi:PST family polysaccharide transporter
VSAVPDLTAPRAVVAQASAPAVVAGSEGYRGILKATALIGGASALNIVVGLVRTKVLAVLLGPAGLGLLGLYGSIVDLVRSVSQLGINSSGVRQIAAAAGTGDARRIAFTAGVLRRVSLLLGLLGAGLLVAASSPLSTLTFGSAERASSVALLGAAVFFRIVSDSQGALIQGLRRIGDFARVGFFGALLGSLASIALVAVWGERAVVPSLVAMAAGAALVSWWYARRVPMATVSLRWAEVRRESGALLGLGLAFMASGLIMMASAYGVRLIVLRHDGLDAAGYYQAAWTLGGLYVGFVLQAMGADFYPRLVALIHDDARSNQVVNEQAQVSLLLAGPGMAATLTLASLVLSVFYSSAFGEAAETLRWVCLGMTLRVVTWPMGFIIVARGDQRLFFITELAWGLVSVGLAWMLVSRYGHRGAGMAFFGSYVFHALMLYPIVRSLSGFRWSVATARSVVVFGVSVAAVFMAFQWWPTAWALATGALVTLASTVYSLRELLRLASPQHLPASLRRLLGALRMHSQGQP